MNHYIRTIGSMLILVYSMLAAFLFIDKVFVNIIYFQGMFYTQIFGIPVFLFLGDRPTINKQDVNQIINRSLEQNVFLLTEYIQKRKKEQAIHLVKDLITMKEEPIKLLALITSNYRLFYQCKILSQKGYSGQQIAKTIGVHPYRVKLALGQVRHYQLDELLNIIDACAETDYKLKSSYMDKQLILELFILSL